jgi:hypothetical protein
MGRVTPEMEAIIREHVQGKEVWDIGCGVYLGWSHKLLDWGAKEVVAVDKEEVHPNLYRGRAIRNIRNYYTDLQVPSDGIEVAYLSWPTNHILHGLLPILERCRKVIYLGCNYHGSACGWPGLYRHFWGREVLGHVEVYQNTLTVYGGPCEPRNATGQLTHEEKCGYSGVALPLPG